MYYEFQFLFILIKLRFIMINKNDCKIFYEFDKFYLFIIYFNFIMLIFFIYLFFFIIFFLY